MNRIASLLAPLTPLAVLRPWPRYEVDAATWEAIGAALAAGAGELMALWAEPTYVHVALRAPDLIHPAVVSLATANKSFPSLGKHHAPALRPERAIRDLYGLEPIGIPDHRPWLDHGAWDIAAPLGARTPAPARDPADYPFLPVHGHGLHQIPVGPVHAGIIEPRSEEHTSELQSRFGISYAVFC